MVNRTSECLKSLSDAQLSMDEHYRHCDRLHGGSYNEHGVEAKKRLTQMQWFLEEIGRRIDRESELHVPRQQIGDQLHSGEITPEQWAEKVNAHVMQMGGEMFRLMSELETLTEAFYWISFRTKSVISKLPGLRNFDPIGVRNVRNKLLEHPEGADSGVIWGGFASGGPMGPVLKAPRYDHQTDIWPDAGLFANAIEFSNDLKRHAELSVVGNPPPVDRPHWPRV